MVIALLSYVGITAYNVNKSRKKIKKSNKKIEVKLNDVGYEINELEANNLSNAVVRAYDERYFNDYSLALIALNYFPLLNIVTCFNNLKSDKFLSEYYECAVDNCLNNKVLEQLETENIIITNDEYEKLEDYREYVVKISEESSKEKEIINDFKKDNRSLEELCILRNYIDSEISKSKIKTK